MSRPDSSTLAPPGRVLLPLLAAAALEALAWAQLLPAGALDGGWYGRPELLRAVHTLALGVLGLSLFGAGWQIVPVITTRPWPAPLAPLANIGLILGLFGMLWGFGRGGAIGHLGASLAALAFSVRAVGVIGAMLRAKGRPVVRAWIVCAELCGLAGVTLGLLLWAGRSGAPTLHDPIAGIGRHLGLMLGGLFGGWMIGAGSVLLPMFSVTSEPSGRALAVGAALWFGGVALGWPALWLMGAAVSVLTLLRAMAAGARRGPALGQAALGLFGLMVTGAAVLALGIGAQDGALVFALFTLGALPVLRGVAQRIGPFFAWSYAAKGGLRGAPSVARFGPESWMWVQWMLSLCGGVLLVAGRFLANGDAARLGAALSLLGALAQLALLTRAAVLAALLAGTGGEAHVAHRQGS